MNAQAVSDDIDFSEIAQYLSELSQGSRMPEGITPAFAELPFTAEEVAFNDNSWLQKTIQLQAWLCLDQPVSLTASASDTALHLMEQISPDPAESCIELGSFIKLTDLGAQHLETRLSRAVSHRESFVEAIEDGRDFLEASKEWELLWEEVETLAREPVTIKAEVKTFTIRNFADYAKDNALELNPSYQRDSVWSLSESQLLIDSILRGIPLPSIILVEGGGPLQIVDGKQRLTAILRFIGQHPDARRFVHSSSDDEAEFDSDFRKFIRSRHLRSRDVADHYLPFPVRRYPPGDPLHAISGKYYSEIKDEEIGVGQNKTKIVDIFAKAHSSYHIPVIIYSQTRLQDIYHVFSVYNKQGKKLNAEELRNATFHHLSLTRLLIALSGDRPDVGALAPYLPPSVTSDIKEVGEILEERGFGTMRFRRTKVLSWVCAIMLHPPNQGRDNRYVTPSTASHIDALLHSIDKRHGSHSLFQSPTLISLAEDVKSAVSLHSELDDAWSPKFLSKKGQLSRWEELPLVASLLATLILVAAGQSHRLSDGLSRVRVFTEASPGPEKTQNKTQWEYIAKVSLGILELLAINLEEAGMALENRYGYNCIKVLSSVHSNSEINV